MRRCIVCSSNRRDTHVDEIHCCLYRRRFTCACGDTRFRISLPQRPRRCRGGCFPSGILLNRVSKSYWRVAINLPPLNIFGPKNIGQLEEIVAAIETDPNVKVVVFESAVDGYFLTHWDFLAKLGDAPSPKVGRTGLQPLPDLLARPAGHPWFPSHRSAGGRQA